MADLQTIYEFKKNTDFCCKRLILYFYNQNFRNMNRLLQVKPRLIFGRFRLVCVDLRRKLNFYSGVEFLIDGRSILDRLSLSNANVFSKDLKRDKGTIWDKFRSFADLHRLLVSKYPYYQFAMNQFNWFANQKCMISRQNVKGGNDTISDPWEHLQTCNMRICFIF